MEKENEDLKKRNLQMLDTMAEIMDADNIIVDTVTALTKENTEELQKNIPELCNDLDYLIDLYKDSDKVFKL